MRRVDLWGPRRQGRVGIEDGRKRLILDRDQRRGQARGPGVVGRHGGEDVADAAHLLALGHEARPVVVQQAVPALAGDVRGGHHGAHAVERSRPRRVDAHDPGARVRGEDEGPVQEALALHVGHVGPGAEGLVEALVAGERLSDPAVSDRLRHRAAAPGPRHQLHRLDDLRVAGAAAEVAVDGAGDLVAARAGLPVEEVLGAQRDPGDAEAALHAPGRGERLRNHLALARGEAFEGQYLVALGPLRFHRAGHEGATVDQSQAAAALALGLAAVLDRRDAAPLTQCVEEGLARAPARSRPAGR